MPWISSLLNLFKEYISKCDSPAISCCCPSDHDQAQGKNICRLCRQEIHSLHQDTVQGCLKDGYCMGWVSRRQLNKWIPCGVGNRRTVTSTPTRPKNWHGFLHNSDNKVELFIFLSEKINQSRIEPEKQLYATKGSNVLTWRKGGNWPLQPRGGW